MMALTPRALEMWFYLPISFPCELVLLASRNTISLLDYYNKSGGLGYLLNTWNIRRDSLGVEAVRPTIQTSRPPVSSSGSGSEVDIDTKEDMNIDFKSEADNYTSCSVKLEHLSDGFLTILENIKVDTNPQEDVVIPIKSEMDDFKPCFVKLERISDCFLTTGNHTQKHNGKLNCFSPLVRSKLEGKIIEKDRTKSWKKCKEEWCSKWSLGERRLYGQHEQVKRYFGFFRVSYVLHLRKDSDIPATTVKTTPVVSSACQRTTPRTAQRRTPPPRHDTRNSHSTQLNKKPSPNRDGSPPTPKATGRDFHSLSPRPDAKTYPSRHHRRKDQSNQSINFTANP
uniref:Uncharacterized protein n=1 Tax=Timema douglasi TaxID=61478 RepID=A0A7R8VV06_TIMDO|nr:unnamed protein product [Timema douglasi]